MIADGEIVTRYVLRRDWLYKANLPGTPIKPNAWMPLPYKELSVYRISTWDEAQINAKGLEVAAEREANHRAKILSKGEPYPDDRVTFKYLGRGDISVRSIRETQLDAISAEPPIGHADIVNWPPLTNNEAHDEATYLAKTLKLSQASSFVRAS